ncbi:bone morphogenetic protein 1 homolog [Ylistrum balloti]|uniref:bone morphogenetic protein 1 homolog n=1 Tax=Ylistrum balloti TaxID=509963 RepID=UPI002905CEF0|nr:bone morphogenetic protein 1 homolog [Ylistrum balloti]
MDKFRFGNSVFQYWIVLSVCLLASGQLTHNECVLDRASLNMTDWSEMIHGHNGTKDCVWKITVPPGNMVKVNFTVLPIDGFIPTSNCSRHSVKVKAGNETKFFCSTSDSTTWTVPSNQVEVSLVSADTLHTEDIFSMYYEAVCGGMQDLDATFLPELPPAAKDCTWTIKHNKKGRKVAFHIGNAEDWVFDIKTTNGTIHPDDTNPWIYLDLNTINITVHRRTDAITYNSTSMTSNNTKTLGLTVQSLGADNPCPDVCGKYGYCEPKNFDSEYLCHCMKGYKGRNCTDIAYDGPYCDENVEHVIGDKVLVHWAITEVNDTDSKPCPQDRIGNIFV